MGFCGGYLLKGVGGRGRLGYEGEDRANWFNICSGPSAGKTSLGLV